MPTLIKGRYRARFGVNAGDVLAAQTLRYRAFFGVNDGPGDGSPGDVRANRCANGVDIDAFDDRCRHILIEDTQTGALVACFRILPVMGHDIGDTYSAQYYDLGTLSRFAGPMIEMGRFCVDPAMRNGDIVRVAWAAMTAYVDENNIEMLFGCTSFSGVDAAIYNDAFGVLAARHLAPVRWRPEIHADNMRPDNTRVVRFGADSAADKGGKARPDTKRAMAQMPALLRTYLLMGGWVSDHAVIDPALNTMHVFTGLEIGAIPAARKRILRAMTG